VVDGTTERGWQPLITDPDRRAAIAGVIVDIVAETAAWRRDHEAVTDHDADYATLRIYAATDDTVPDPDDEAGQALERAVTGIADRSGPTLYGGAARVAFAVGHLSAGDDADLACEMIERSLLRFVEQPSAAYDLISGYVGLAVPVLQRIADGKPSPSSEALARNILDHLERLARPMASGLSWHTPPELLPEWQRALAPDGYTNLGLAHGIPGIVAILARYIAADLDAGRARVLLDGAVAYLRSVARPQVGSRYPAWLPSAGSDTLSRVAWCYGDLGVSVALMSAATATHRDDWRTFALELAHGMAARPFEASQVVDTGLCHGAAGVAHLFNRLAQASGDHALAGVADTWFGRTIAMRRSDPIAGFPRAIPVDGVVSFEPAPDLLTGAIGVALALHAAISPIEPAWDQLLLADLSPAH
jgi:hypothetical protein